MTGPVLFHRVAGTGNGEDAVILLPGLQADHRIWRAVLSILAADWRTVAADNRGFGQTRFCGEPLSIEAMASDVLRLMDTLSVSRVCIAGHSMGGAIAQWLAYHHPERVRALALCNTFRAMRSVELAAIADRLKEPCDAQDWADIQRQLTSRLFAGGALLGAAGAAIAERRAAATNAIHASGLRRQIEALLSFDSRDWVGQLSLPTLIVDSAADRPFFAEEAGSLNRAIRASRRVTLPGGHASTVEQWRALGHLLKTFFGEFGQPDRSPVSVYGGQGALRLQGVSQNRQVSRNAAPL